ncbi:hypothetical protein [Brachybacterium muris]|nr:hypothetical protein [Brachybacterium muris]
MAIAMKIATRRKSGADGPGSTMAEVGLSGVLAEDDDNIGCS